MIHQENGYDICVLIDASGGNPQMPTEHRREAERIALAAAADALRGPKAEPPANCAYCVRRALERMQLMSRLSIRRCK